MRDSVFPEKVATSSPHGSAQLVFEMGAFWYQPAN